MTTSENLHFHNLGTTASASDTNEETLHLIIADMGTEIVFRIFNTLLSNVLVGLVSVLGIMSNITTILVLSQQVNESINIAFIGMAVSDLCVATLSLWFTLACVINETNPPDFPYEPLSFLVMTAIIPKLCFVNATCWLTALIAVIRCLCVVLPFKVGALFTPRRTALLTIGVFSTAVFIYLTAYFRNEFVPIYIPGPNVTRYIMVEISKGQVVDDFVYYLGFVGLPMINIFIVVFCTLALVIKVKASVNWRHTARLGKSLSEKPTPRSAREANTKEGRLTKMIITITTVFIVCNMPNNVVIIARMLEPEFTERGRYQYVFIIIHDIMFLLETINSSVSLLIFYRMSSRFKSGLIKMVSPLNK